MTKVHGCDRPRSEIVATIVSSSSQAGPWRPLTIQPLRSESTQLPTGRSRSGARAIGGREPSAGPRIRPGLMSSSGSVSRTPTAAIQRPSGDHAGWFAQPAAARTSYGGAGSVGSTSTAQIVVRGWRSGSGPRSAVNAIVRPSGCQAMSSTPKSPCVTWRGRAPRSASTTNRCDQRSRWPSSSQRQSVRSMWRASGASVSVVARREIGGTGPTRKRGGSTSAVNASRRPSGDHASSPTAPCRPRRTARTRRGTARSSRWMAATEASSAGSVRTKASAWPSGDRRGRTSRVMPVVNVVGRGMRRAAPTSMAIKCET